MTVAMGVRQAPKTSTGMIRGNEVMKYALGCLVLEVYSCISNSTQTIAPRVEHQMPTMLDDGENANINAKNPTNSAHFGWSAIQCKMFFFVSAGG